MDIMCPLKVPVLMQKYLKRGRIVSSWRFRERVTTKRNTSKLPGGKQGSPSGQKLGNAPWRLDSLDAIWMPESKKRVF